MTSPERTRVTAYRPNEEDGNPEDPQIRELIRAVREIADSVHEVTKLATKTDTDFRSDRRVFQGAVAVLTFCSAIGAYILIEKNEQLNKVVDATAEIVSTQRAMRDELQRQSRVDDQLSTLILDLYKRR